MNSKIIEYYQNIINLNLEYFNSSTIRSSLEDYKSKMLKETEELSSESDKKHNINFLNSFYSESIEALEEGEEEMNIQISFAIEKIKTIDEQELSNKIKKQVINSLGQFKLKPDYENFNGLLFEFDSGPNFSGIAFKESKFDIILETPKYLEFKDGSYASDYSIDFELEEFLEPILNEDFDETAWAFEFELDIFLKLKETFYSVVAMCLNRALSSEEIKLSLNEKGFEENGVAYLNEHDMEVRTVFVNQ